MDTATYEVTIEHTEEGRLSDSKKHTLNIPVRKIVPADLVESLFDICDSLIHFEISRQNVTCKKGCSFCCNQLLPLSIPEAFYIYRLVHELPQKQKRPVKARFGQILQKMQAEGLLKGAGAEKKQADTNISFDERYFALELGCPFLEGGSCMVYKKRPLICRWYNVVSEPQKCRNLYEQPVEKARIKRNPGAVLAAFAAQLYHLPPGPVPLPLALKWVEENTSLLNGQWSGAFLFEAYMNGLESMNDEVISVSYKKV